MATSVFHTQVTFIAAAVLLPTAALVFKQKVVTCLVFLAEVARFQSLSSPSGGGSYPLGILKS